MSVGLKHSYYWEEKTAEAGSRPLFRRRLFLPGEVRERLIPPAEQVAVIERMIEDDEEDLLAGLF